MTKRASLIIKHFEKLGIYLNEEEEKKLKDTCLVNVGEYTCWVVNFFNNNPKFCVNKNWFQADSRQKPSINPRALDGPSNFEIYLIPFEEKLYFLHYIELREYAFKLEKNRDDWFNETWWTAEINSETDEFKWFGNEKYFPLKLFSLENLRKLPDVDDKELTEDKKYSSSTVVRRIRDTKVSKEIKVMYNYTCQICQESLKLDDVNYYAEAHHLKPLGGEHEGPDVKENIICVCPNHHVLLDNFALPLDLEKMDVHPDHNLSLEFINYNNKKVQETKRVKSDR
ncbi:HNH endonuclease [Natranaerofaba carboxydovora]|uniref:HNH endonuclease n=1 Tax=Natranaerofaba carboxydovora TaxID=2742683 RepID=UPI001F1394B7|nr:HNH endonuclease [Natranaerofaba carboxydovora]